MIITIDTQICLNTKCHHWNKFQGCRLGNCAKVKNCSQGGYVGNFCPIPKNCPYKNIHISAGRFNNERNNYGKQCQNCFKD